MKKIYVFIFSFALLESVFAYDCKTNKLNCFNDALQLVSNSLHKLSRDVEKSYNLRQKDILILKEIITDELADVGYKVNWIFNENDSLTVGNCRESVGLFDVDDGSDIYLCHKAFTSIENLASKIVHEAYHFYQYRFYPISMNSSNYIIDTKLIRECIASEAELLFSISANIKVDTSDYFFMKECLPTYSNILNFLEKNSVTPNLNKLVAKSLKIEVDKDFIPTKKPYFSWEIEDIKEQIKASKYIRVSYIENDNIDYDNDYQRAQGLISKTVRIVVDNLEEYEFEVMSLGMPLYLEDLENLLGRKLYYK